MSETTARPRAGLRRPHWLTRSLRVLELAELTLGALLLTAIVVLVMLLVVARISPLDSEVWHGELARYSLMWLTFGMSGYLLGRDEHIALDLSDRVLPRLGTRIVRAFAMIVVGVTSIAFAYDGWHIVSSGSPIKTPATGIPLTWVYIIPTIGFVLTALRAAIEIVFPVEHDDVLHVAGAAVVQDVAEPPPGHVTAERSHS